MKQIKTTSLWMLAAILGCGLLWTSCSNADDPPVAPPTDVLNAELEGVWYEENDAEGTKPTSPQPPAASFHPLNV